MQAKKKILEGYMRFYDEAMDPNFIEAVNRYGSVNAVYEAVEAWKKEAGDPTDIPLKEIIRMLSKENKYLQLAHP